MKELITHRTLLPAVERWATKAAFHDGDYHATFEQHGDRVLRLADAMANQLGIQKSDRVAILACNSHEYLEIYHAGYLGAAILNPLNLRIVGKELQYILADSGTEVIFVDSVFADHLARSIADVGDSLPLRHVVLIGDGDGPHDIRYEDLIEAGRPLVPPEPEEDDPVIRRGPPRRNLALRPPADHFDANPLLGLIKYSRRSPDSGKAILRRVAAPRPARSSSCSGWRRWS